MDSEEVYFKKGFNNFFLRHCERGQAGKEHRQDQLRLVLSL